MHRQVDLEDEGVVDQFSRIQVGRRKCICVSLLKIVFLSVKFSNTLAISQQKKEAEYRLVVGNVFFLPPVHSIS